MLQLLSPSVIFDMAADTLDPRLVEDTYTSQGRKYLYDPVGWFAEFVPGIKLTQYQRECMTMLPDKLRVCERGPHGLGKTLQAAGLVLWFALTRDALMLDWKCVTTASVWRQLKHYLWPEIHKLSRMLDWRKLGRKPFTKFELKKMILSLRSGEAFAASSDEPGNIEGAHADCLLYVFDESKSIRAETFDAAEGALSGTGEAYAFAISTPGEPVGRFYDIQSRKPGLEDWWVRHVTLQEAISAGRIEESWAKARARYWTESSAIYQNRVLGNFATDSVDGIIPLTWIEAANERWYELQPKEPAPLTCIGVDVARFGSDKTILALRRGFFIERLRELNGADTMEITGLVAALLKKASAGYACVDVIGVGSGVVDRLREQGFDVESYNAASRARESDSTGELEFLNRRAASWWALREELDPANDPVLALPPDESLTGDLVTPHYKRTSSGRIRLEEKDEIRKRIGRSPDRGDAVVMAIASRLEPEVEGVYVYDDPVAISPV